MADIDRRINHKWKQCYLLELVPMLKELKMTYALVFELLVRISLAGVCVTDIKCAIIL